MVDITLCLNRECLFHQIKKCYRATAIASSRQSYANFKPKESFRKPDNYHIECDYFLENKEDK